MRCEAGKGEEAVLSPTSKANKTRQDRAVVVLYPLFSVLTWMGQCRDTV